MYNVANSQGFPQQKQKRSCINGVKRNIQVKSKSNQVYCYTNNINYLTTYNKYNEALHIKYIFQLHLLQLEVPV